MVTIPSRPVRSLIVLVFIVVTSAVSTPVLAQDGAELFEEPHREYQIAFANGVKAAIEHLYREMIAGELDIADIAALAENEEGRLVRFDRAANGRDRNRQGTHSGDDSPAESEAEQEVHSCQLCRIAGEHHRE